LSWGGLSDFDDLGWNRLLIVFLRLLQLGGGEGRTHAKDEIFFVARFSTANINLDGTLVDQKLLSKN
jgi:hypothetical protein